MLKKNEVIDKQSKRNISTIVALLVISLALISTFVYFTIKGSGYERNKRQAIFASNGLVYFCYVKEDKPESIIVEDIYYISYQNLLNPSENNKLTLTKNGEEVYGPENRMEIFKNQVFIIQPMKSNSKINDAIRDFVKNNK